MSIFKKGAVTLATMFCVATSYEARAQYIPDPIQETGRAMENIVRDGFETGREMAPYALGATVALGLGVIGLVEYDKRRKKAEAKPNAPKPPVPQN